MGDPLPAGSKETVNNDAITEHFLPMKKKPLSSKPGLCFNSAQVLASAMRFD